MKYFEDEIMYPQYLADTGMEYGTLYMYVNYEYLNVYIKHVKPIYCLVLERYKNNDEYLENSFFTKSERISILNNSSGKKFHDNLNSFEDDVIIVAQIPTEDNIKNKYMYFWFDRDVSDCFIGKFITDDNLDNIKENILNSLKEGNLSEAGTENRHIELNIDVLSSWLYF